MDGWRPLAIDRGRIGGAFHACCLNRIVCGAVNGKCRAWGTARSWGSRLPLMHRILREPAREEIATQGTVKKATEVMHVELGRAVSALRRRLEWSQTELARAIDKQGRGAKVTDYMTISRWERGIDSPSPAKRMALAKISTDRKSTRLNSSHRCISYAVFCLKKKKKK